MPADLAHLRQSWDQLCHGVATPAQRQAVFDDLVLRYSEPHRHYHTLDHIAACLDAFDQLRSLAAEPDVVQTAIWFHDAVYDPRRADNEQRSADVADAAERSLDTSRAFRRAVRELILATRHDVTPPARDGDARLLVDIDLLIFAASPERFDAYEGAIRREYAHVADEPFRAGRAAVIRRFLERPAIYLTPPIRERHEGAARANLERSLRRWSGGAM
jgi:predicted metal-dependent HD superfamily phosphohydrolase